MDWDGCVNLAQSYLENSPLIVLGSGASMPYGLPYSFHPKIRDKAKR